MLTRDFRAHFDNRTGGGGGGRVRQVSVGSDFSVPDSTCRRCHDPSRKITMRFGTLINHSEHAKRNKSCASCHLWTAHPDPKAEKPMLMMERCFACHGRTASAKAPGTCDVCHPASFSLTPASHKPKKQWRTGHGKVALAKGQPCEICHDKQFCTDCHGLEMPHPAGWGKAEGGKRAGHAKAAPLRRSACFKCHTQPDLCSMCHHQGYDPAKGPWLRQHPALAAERGAAFCLDCHSPIFCAQCHISGNKPEKAIAY